MVRGHSRTTLDDNFNRAGLAAYEENLHQSLVNLPEKKQARGLRRRLGRHPPPKEVAIKTQFLDLRSAPSRTPRKCSTVADREKPPSRFRLIPAVAMTTTVVCQDDL